MRTKCYKLDHCTYSCSYHIVWAPRYRGKVLVKPFLKQELKREFPQIARWKGLIIHAWHIGDEHIHLYLTIPPKYSASYIIQVLKGKTSNWLKKKTKQFPPGPLWARGYFVSTVGIQEAAIRRYIQDQSHHKVELQKLF